MENTVIIEILVLLVAVITVAITIIKMWFSFNAKLEEHKTSVLVALKEHETKICTTMNEVSTLKVTHDADMAEVSGRFEKTYNLLRSENREDHAKLFDKLEGVNVLLSKVNTIFDQKQKRNVG